MRKSGEIPDRSRSSKTFSALRSLKRTQDEYFALYTVILIMMPWVSSDEWNSLFFRVPTHGQSSTPRTRDHSQDSRSSIYEFSIPSRGSQIPDTKKTYLVLFITREEKKRLIHFPAWGRSSRILNGERDYSKEVGVGSITCFGVIKLVDSG